MPLLPNPRHEAFAQARAQGARLEIAYEDAGFAAGQGHASRLAAQPEAAALCRTHDQEAFVAPNSGAREFKILNKTKG